MAAPVYQSWASAANGAGGVCSKPTGVASGDLMVAFVSIAFTNGVTITPPSGWTEVGTGIDIGGSFPLQGAIYWKIAGGSEPSSYTWGTGGEFTSIAIARITGHDATTPIDAHAFGSAESSATRSWPGATATTAEDLLILATLGYEYQSTTPSGMTQIGNYEENFGALFRQTLSASGATGTRTHTQSGAQTNVTMGVLIKPSGGSPPAVEYDGALSAVLSIGNVTKEKAVAASAAVSAVTAIGNVVTGAGKAFAGAVQAVVAVAGTGNKGASRTGAVGAAGTAAGDGFKLATWDGLVNAVLTIELDYTALVEVTFDGAVEAVATIAGTGAKSYALTGAMSAVASLSSTGVRGASLSGALEVIGVLSGTGYRGAPFDGAVDAIAVLSGTGQKDTALSGAVEAIATIAGTWDVEAPGQARTLNLSAVMAWSGVTVKAAALDGEVLVIATPAGTYLAARETQGAVEGVATLSGGFDAYRATLGAVTAILTTDPGDTTTARSITGAVSARAVFNIIWPGAGVSYDGALSCVASLAASYSAHRRATGAWEALGVVEGTGTKGTALAGSLEAVATIAAGTVEYARRWTGAAVAVARAAASWTGAHARSLALGVVARINLSVDRPEALDYTVRVTLVGAPVSRDIQGAPQHSTLTGAPD